MMLLELRGSEESEAIVLSFFVTCDRMEGRRGAVWANRYDLPEQHRPAPG